MLLELRVRNLGIIDDLVWQLRDGLNVITGETGAGKSLLIDAVELLLSGKADEGAIRHGADEAEVEGVFAVSGAAGLSHLRSLLNQRGVSGDDSTLAIECRLRRHGPAITRVNTRAVPRALLQSIGRFLVDIHGESEHLSLLDASSHLELLDSYAHTWDLRNELKDRFAALRKVDQEARALSENEAERARREDFLRFQIAEIDEAGLREAEEDELEAERNVLASAEKLKELTGEVYGALHGEDMSAHAQPALDRLSECMQAMKRLVALDPALSDQLKAMEDAVYGLTEVARDVRAYGDRLDGDPDRMEQIESRLEQLSGLKRKYGHTINDVLDYRRKAGEELDSISGSSERVRQLEQMSLDLKRECGRIAGDLSEKRSRSSGTLEKSVKNELCDLNMAEVVFEISITRKPSPDGVPFPDGKVYAMSEDGADLVQFMVSTNPGEPMKPLAKIASTGEMSRFALALETALSGSDSIPILVFDEIDLGIGGRSGEAVGRKLWRLGQGHQVICVTHLPQIAAFADAHFNVQKVTSGDRTVSTLESLDEKAKIGELAAMLSGPNLTDTSLRNARELVTRAARWKEQHGR